MAFANTAGGSLLIGVEDRSRNVRSGADPLDEEEATRQPDQRPDQPSAGAGDRDPALAADAGVGSAGLPQPEPPHHLIREGTAAGVYVRVGSTNRRADAELIEEL